MQLTRFARLSAIVVAVVAIAIATAAATQASASGTQRRAPISAARAFIFPSTKVCVSGHKLTFRLRQLPHVRWRKVRVFVNGRHFKTVKLSRIPQPVKLSGLPSGRFVLRATAYTSDGRHVTASRTYNACAGKPAVHTLTVSLSGSGSGTVSGSGISCPGTCSHSYTAGTTVTLTASPGSGSSFAGWSGGGCSGTGTCTVTMSADETVSASFAVVTNGPNPGAYAGPTSQYSNNPLLFYVSSDRSQVQDVTFNYVVLSCTPSTPTPSPSPDDSFYLASIPIAPNGSFSGTTTVTGVISNAPVHITYTVSGQFTGSQTAAGSFRENISYDGTSTVCTSNTQTWSATFSSQGNQAALAPPAGGYAGPTSQYSNNPVSLYVSSDSTHLQDVTLNYVPLSCTPATPAPNPSPNGSFYIASIPINADGSFSSTASQSTVIGNAAVHITYTFNGHFHGRNAGNEERIAGSFREDISYDGTSTSCTSDTQWWSALFINQGNQAALAPPAGSYAGPTSQYSNNPVSLYVSSDSTHLQDVTLNYVPLSCTPATPAPNPSPNGSFYIGSIPINADGSFSGTTSQTSVIGNAPVHITYTFSGHFHGRNASDVERIAGMFREDISYDGASTTCTSGNQFWSAIWAAQGNQAALAPPPGGYAGPTSQYSNNPVSLTVSSDSTELQNVTINFVVLACTPATPTHNPSPDNSFDFASIPINADGSFSGTVTQTGLEGSAPVHFTYTFSGHFHGRNSSNKERIAGMFREDISYDGTSTTCTSGNQFWTATEQ